MKRIIKSFSSFSRAERMGIYCISLLLLLLLLCRVMLPYWYAPERAPESDRKMAADWEQMQAQPAGRTSETVISVVHRKATPITKREKPAVVNWIDLNTVNAVTLMEVTGMNETDAQEVVYYRERHGQYTSIAQLIALFHFRDTVARRIRNQFVVMKR